MSRYSVTCFHLRRGALVDGDRQVVEAADAGSAARLFIEHPLSLVGDREHLAAEVVRFEGTRVAEYQLFYFGL